MSDPLVATALLVLTASGLLCLYRVGRGPTAPDRTVAIDILGTLVVGFCCLFAILTRQDFYMDIATYGAASCLLVDTVAAGASPGDVLVLDAEDLQHTDFSTHGLSPKAFLEAVAGLSKMNIAILGIQPGKLREGEVLSPVVRHAVDSVVAALQRLTAT